MGEFSVWHWLIVLGVVILLFGTNKLPELARSLGQAARVFKAETRGMRDDEEAAEREKRGEQRPQVTPEQHNASPAGSSTDQPPSRDTGT